MKPLLFIMVKAPVAGRTKTRLAATIGAAEAVRFYRAMSRSLATRLGNDRRWDTVLAVTPDRDLYHSNWPEHLPRISQGHGDLGARMQHLLEAGRGRRVLVIGSDIPGITPFHIARAIAVLGEKPAVLGPAADGGYWLVGCRGTPRIPDFFANVSWSSPTTRDDTVRCLGADNVAIVDELEDVDEAADYQRWKARAGRVV